MSSGSVPNPEDLFFRLIDSADTAVEFGDDGVLDGEDDNVEQLVQRNVVSAETAQSLAEALQSLRSALEGDGNNPAPKRDRFVQMVEQAYADARRDNPDAFDPDARDDAPEEDDGDTLDVSASEEGPEFGRAGQLGEEADVVRFGQTGVADFGSDVEDVDDPSQFRKLRDEMASARRRSDQATLSGGGVAASTEEASSRPAEQASLSDLSAPSEPTGPSCEDLREEMAEQAKRYVESSFVRDVPDMERRSPRLLEGVGETRAERFSEIGIGTIAELAQATPEELVERGIPPSVARDGVSRARVAARDPDNIEAVLRDLMEDFAENDCTEAFRQERIRRALKTVVNEASPLARDEFLEELNQSRRAVSDTPTAQAAEDAVFGIPQSADDGLWTRIDIDPQEGRAFGYAGPYMDRFTPWDDDTGARWYALATSAPDEGGLWRVAIEFRASPMGSPIARQVVSTQMLTEANARQELARFVQSGEAREAVLRAVGFERLPPRGGPPKPTRKPSGLQDILDRWERAQSIYDRDIREGMLPIEPRTPDLPPVIRYWELAVDDPERVVYADGPSFFRGNEYVNLVEVSSESAREFGGDSDNWVLLAWQGRSLDPPGPDNQLALAIERGFRSRAEAVDYLVRYLREEADVRPPRPDGTETGISPRRELGSDEPEDADTAEETPDPSTFDQGTLGEFSNPGGTRVRRHIERLFGSVEEAAEAGRGLDETVCEAAANGDTEALFAHVAHGAEEYRTDLSSAKAQMETLSPRTAEELVELTDDFVFELAFVQTRQRCEDFGTVLTFDDIAGPDSAEAGKRRFSTIEKAREAAVNALGLFDGALPNRDRRGDDDDE